MLVLSTGQHVGKTTVSLGLVKTLQSKFEGSGKKVAYCKPVGQQHVPVGGGLRVDKVTKKNYSRTNQAQIFFRMPIYSKSILALFTTTKTCHLLSSQTDSLVILSMEK
jgi:BioD-like phosphotransacetylase family protein